MRDDFWLKSHQHSPIEPMMANGGQGLTHPSRGVLWEHIPEGSSVLDVGSNRALMLEDAQQRGIDIKYTGVDKMEKAVEWCRERYPKGEFVVGDASDLQMFEKNQFDYVVSRHVVDHLPHYCQHLIDMWDVAKKKVIIVTWRKLDEGDGELLSWGNLELGGSWDNIYNQKILERFIDWNLHPEEVEIIANYKETGNSVIVITKEK